MLSASLLLSVIFGMLSANAENADEFAESFEVYEHQPIDRASAQESRHLAIVSLGGEIG